MVARNLYMELGPPCIGGPLYYLAQRMAARNLCLELGLRVCKGAIVLFGAEEAAEENGRRRRSGCHRRNLATPTPVGNETK